MSSVGFTLRVAAGCLLLAAIGLASEPPGKAGESSPSRKELAAAARLEFRDLQDNKHQPLKMGKNEAVVLIFTTNDCPVANAYSPALNATYEKYRQRKVRFYLVHIDPDLSAKQARQHAKEYQLKIPVLRDTKHRLVRLLRAKKTPEVVVLHGQGIAYQGRVDDRYVALGRKRPQAQRHDLRVALDEVLAGKKVSLPRTAVIGCYIPALERP